MEDRAKVPAQPDGITDLQWANIKAVAYRVADDVPQAGRLMLVMAEIVVDALATVQAEVEIYRRMISEIKAIADSEPTPPVVDSICQNCVHYGALAAGRCSEGSRCGVMPPTGTCAYYEAKTELVSANELFDTDEGDL